MHEDGHFDGERLQHSNVWTMDASGGHKKQVTHLPPFGGDVSSVIWSPDGTRLLCSFTDAATTRRALFLTRADGSATVRLTPWNLGANGVPAWSGKTDLIAFRAVADEDAVIGNLYSIRPDGSEQRQMTHFENRKINHVVSFSPDGRWLASAGGPADGPQDMFLMKTDGTQLRYTDRTPRRGDRSCLDRYHRVDLSTWAFFTRAGATFRGARRLGCTDPVATCSRAHRCTHGLDTLRQCATRTGSSSPAR